MRLLRVRDGPLVAARRVGNGLCAVRSLGVRPGGAHGRLGQRDRVRPHVRDVAVLVESLGDPHRRLRRVAQLPARLLLERGRAEGRRRASAVRLLLDGGDRERPAVEIPRERRRLLLVEDDDRSFCDTGTAEVLALRDARAVDGDETRFERARVERADDVPVRGDHEAHALELPLDDEPRRHRLHAAGGEAAHDLLPEHRRDLVAVETVEDPARLLRVDESLVDVPRVLERADDGVLRDLVEHHAANRHLRLQRLDEMPGDRLAFAVLVRREQQLVRAGELLLEPGHDLLLLRVDDVVRLEVVLDGDT